MKFLTIRQPWASLIAVGAKTIETRPFSTKYRGPLAIHAGKAKPSRDLVRMGQWLTRWDYGEGRYVMSDGLGKWVALPLGAVVAVCDLIDVVPIVLTEPRRARPDEAWLPCVANPQDGGHLVSYWRHDAGEPRVTHYSERPFGDFAAGRYAWILDNVRPIDPVPMKGAQGLRDLPEGVVIP